MTNFFVKAAATEPIDLNGAPSQIGDVPLVTGDTVLATAQTDPAQNGVWAVRAPDASHQQPWWARGSAFDTPQEISPGTMIYVCRGAERGSLWLLANETRPAAVGQTPLLFREYLPGPWRPSRAPFSVGLGRSYAGQNRLEFKPGAIWIPRPNRVLEATAPFAKDFSGLAPYTPHWVYYFRGADGGLDVELTPVFPERSSEPFVLYTKPGDDSRRALTLWSIYTDEHGLIRPATVNT